ncbi:MAG: M15 family metallopeptidase [Bacilli bacterium]|nr:M15 family metallopeptidase [Bacilli bacterium]
MDYAILVNKNNILNETFIPEDLVDCTENDIPRYDSSHKVYLVHEALEAFLKMQNEAFKNGYHIIITSGYRSYEYQQFILNKIIEIKGDEAYKTVAIPGTSEHQTGLAIDIGIKRNGVYIPDAMINHECLQPEIKWAQENAYKFGYILRYPKGKEDITGYNYEQWHFRYVGHSIATEMYENNISTLEEYHKKYTLKRI